MIRLTIEKQGLLKELIGFRFNGLGSININKLKSNPDSYMSIHLKMVMLFKNDLSNKQFVIESDFMENKDADTFYDYTLEYANLPLFQRLLKIPFKSPPIKEIVVYGRRFEINDFKDYPEVEERFATFNKTDDAFVFKCDDNQEVLLYFHHFLPRVTITSNQNEQGCFWNNIDELYEKHLVIKK